MDHDRGLVLHFESVIFGWSGLCCIEPELSSLHASGWLWASPTWPTLSSFILIWRPRQVRKTKRREKVFGSVCLFKASKPVFAPRVNERERERVCEQPGNQVAVCVCKRCSSDKHKHKTQFMTTGRKNLSYENVKTKKHLKHLWNKKETSRKYLFKKIYNYGYSDIWTVSL